jgi:hypothetical protein
MPVLLDPVAAWSNELRSMPEVLLAEEPAKALESSELSDDTELMTGRPRELA